MSGGWWRQGEGLSFLVGYFWECMPACPQAHPAPHTQHPFPFSLTQDAKSGRHIPPTHPSIPKSWVELTGPLDICRRGVHPRPTPCPQSHQLSGLAGAQKPETERKTQRSFRHVRWQRRQAVIQKSQGVHIHPRLLLPLSSSSSSSFLAGLFVLFV